MPYIIKDCIDNAQFGPFVTKEETLYRYRALCRNNICGYPGMSPKLDFKYLNVTGKDITISTERVGHAFVYGIGMLPEFRDVTRQRRYQILDDAGRSYDIRAWRQEIAKVESTWERVWASSKEDGHYLPTYRVDPVPGSYHRPRHLLNGPAMWRDTMARKRNAKENALDLQDDLDDLGMRPVLNHAAPRRPDLPHWGIDDYADKKHANKWGDKSWKKHSKSSKQWAKHKTGVTKGAMRRSSWSAHSDLCRNLDAEWAIDYSAAFVDDFDDVA